LPLRFFCVAADCSNENLVGKDVPVHASSEDFISGADRVEMIFANDNESDDDFAGWGEDSEALHKSD